MEWYFFLYKIKGFELFETFKSKKASIILITLKSYILTLSSQVEEDKKKLSNDESMIVTNHAR